MASTVQYGISVIESDADMVAVRAAIADLAEGIDQPEDSNQVFVSIDHVGEAVKRVNALGYTTDEE